MQELDLHTTAGVMCYSSSHGLATEKLLAPGAWELLARNLGKQLGHTEEVFTLKWRPNNSSRSVTHDHGHYH